MWSFKAEKEPNWDNLNVQKNIEWTREGDNEKGIGVDGVVWGSDRLPTVFQCFLKGK